MSLITRCPVCATLFKVVPDQLRISAGWVRCGVCAEVFDASAQMLLASESSGLEPVESESLPLTHAIPHDQGLVPESGTKPSESGSEISEQSAASSELGDTQEEALAVVEGPGEEQANARAPTLPEPQVVPRQADEFAPPRANALFARPANLSAPASAPASLESAESRLVKKAESPEPLFERSPVESSPVDTQAADASEADSWLDAVAREAADEEEALAPAEEVPSFVRQARRRAFWGSRGVRSALWLFLLLLALGLGGQWAVSQRDWLAASEPRLVPLLELLCRPAGCAIAPYRDLKVIVIDGSSFQRVSADSFQLNFGLRNNGDIPVATPSLQLTLTDAQNQALLQRVLKAQDLSAPPALAAQGEFNGTSALSVDVQDPTAIVGYRLVAFYP